MAATTGPPMSRVLRCRPIQEVGSEAAVLSSDTCEESSVAVAVLRGVDLKTVRLQRQLGFMAASRGLGKWRVAKVVASPIAWKVAFHRPSQRGYPGNATKAKLCNECIR